MQNYCCCWRLDRYSLEKIESLITVRSKGRGEPRGLKLATQSQKRVIHLSGSSFIVLVNSRNDDNATCENGNIAGNEFRLVLQ